MKTKSFACIVFISATFACSLKGSAQKQCNVWAFGQGGFINFNNATVSAYGGGLTGWQISPGFAQEGTASICDSTGALLF